MQHAVKDKVRLLEAGAPGWALQKLGIFRCVVISRNLKSFGSLDEVKRGVTKNTLESVPEDNW